MSSDAHHPVGEGASGGPPESCYETLGHPRRLRLLATLREAESPIALSTLVDRLAAAESAAGRDGVRLSLVHDHLPRLADAEVIRWDREATTVDLVGDFPLEARALHRLLAHCDGPDGEAVLDAIVHPVRMPLLSTVTAAEGPVSVERLADDLARSRTCPLDDRERATVALVHAHLPKLADVGVVAYDGSNGMVSEVTRARVPSF